MKILKQNSFIIVSTVLYISVFRSDTVETLSISNPSPIHRQSFSNQFKTIQVRSLIITQTIFLSVLYSPLFLSIRLIIRIILGFNKIFLYTHVCVYYIDVYKKSLYTLCCCFGPFSVDFLIVTKSILNRILTSSNQQCHQQSPHPFNSKK